MGLPLRVQLPVGLVQLLLQVEILGLDVGQQFLAHRVQTPVLQQPTVFRVSVSGLPGFGLFGPLHVLKDLIPEAADLAFLAQSDLFKVTAEPRHFVGGFP